MHEGPGGCSSARALRSLGRRSAGRVEPELEQLETVVVVVPEVVLEATVEDEHVERRRRRRADPEAGGELRIRHAIDRDRHVQQVARYVDGLPGLGVERDAVA